MSSVTFALQARTFRSLRRHYNYRLFFAGQIVSLAGSWMQNVALAWLVLSLSRSPLAVATLLFCRFAPYTVFGLFAGSIVDRLNTRRLVVWTQVAAMTISAALAVVTLTGTATLPVVFALATLGGVTLVLDAPGRQSLTFEMVGPRRAPQRRRAQLGSAQRFAGDRPRDRRSPDRHRRRRRLLPRQHPQLRRRPRGPARDARGRALSGCARSHRHAPRRHAGRAGRSPGTTARYAPCSWS